MGLAVLNRQHPPDVVQRRAALGCQTAGAHFCRVDRRQFGQVLFKDQAELLLAAQAVSFLFQSRAQRLVFDLGDQVIYGRQAYAPSG